MSPGTTLLSAHVWSRYQDYRYGIASSALLLHDIRLVGVWLISRSTHYQFAGQHTPCILCKLYIDELNSGIGSDLKHWDAIFQNVSVPAKTTYYRCEVLKIPTQKTLYVKAVSKLDNLFQSKPADSRQDSGQRWVIVCQAVMKLH